MTIKSKTTLAIDFDRHHYRFNHNRQINFRLTQYIKYTVLQLIQHLKSKSLKIEMHRNRKHTNKTRKSSQAALLPHQRFPSNIRTELRMACVLRGMSSLKQGPQKTQKLQQQALFNFYHGKGEKSPSQIDMLVNGIGAYKDLYDLKTQLIVVKRKGIKKKATTQQSNIPGTRPGSNAINKLAIQPMNEPNRKMQRPINTARSQQNSGRCE